MFWCFADRFFKQQESIAEECRRHDETLHLLEHAQHEQEQLSAANQAKLQTYIADIVEELSVRVTQQEKHHSKEYVEKLSHVEKVFCFVCISGVDTTNSCSNYSAEYEYE